MDGQNTNNKKKNLKEIVLYLIFGVATTLVNWIVYLLFNNLIFNRFFSENTAMTAANAVAWFLAVLFAFVTNKLIVFKSKEKTARILIPELLSFYASRGLTGLLEIFVPTLLVNAGITFTLLGDGGIFPNALQRVHLYDAVGQRSRSENDRCGRRDNSELCFQQTYRVQKDEKTVIISPSS